jgi:hypothetical protein
MKLWATGVRGTLRGFTYRRRLPGQGGHGDDVHQRSGDGAAGQGIDHYPETGGHFQASVAGFPSPSSMQNQELADVVAVVCNKKVGNVRSNGPEKLKSAWQTRTIL